VTLTCPRCALPHESEERFCRNCGMPLVYSGPEEESSPLTAHEEWARKIRPQYARGELRRVAGGRNQSEAEMIQGMLLEEGIPSILRRTRGFDVPDFLAAGPRDVMVAESGYEAATSLLSDVGLQAREGPADAMPGIGSPAKLAAGLLAVLALGTIVAFVVYLITG
jgi:hypothetical protein